MEVYKQFLLPPRPKVEPQLPCIYPWEQTNLLNLCQQLFMLAQQTGFHGTFDEFKTYFGSYLENDDIIIDLDEYTGEYTVTPLPTMDQILRTRHKNLKHDIIIKPIPYVEVSNEAGGTTVIIG